MPIWLPSRRYTILLTTIHQNLFQQWNRCQGHRTLPVYLRSREWRCQEGQRHWPMMQKTEMLKSQRFHWKWRLEKAEWLHCEEVGTELKATLELLFPEIYPKMANERVVSSLFVKRIPVGPMRGTHHCQTSTDNVLENGWCRRYCWATMDSMDTSTCRPGFYQINSMLPLKKVEHCVQVNSDKPALSFIESNLQHPHQLNENFGIDQKLAASTIQKENSTAPIWPRVSCHDGRCQQIEMSKSIKSFPGKNWCLRRPTWIHLDSMETSQQRHGFNQINSILLLQKCKRVDIMFKSKVASHHLALLT